jgi:UDP-2,3-diacylglucosamine pyrophosphatase LpxH
MGENSIKRLGTKYKNLVGEAAYDNRNVTIKNITKDYSNKFDTLQVCFISDLHIGSSDFDIQGLLDTLKYAESQENAVIFFLGDSQNTAIIGSKSDAYQDILGPHQQLDIFANILKIAKGDRELSTVLQRLSSTGKIVVLHSGNHEERITKAVGINTTEIAANIAGIEDSFAQFYANTELLLRQEAAEDGKYRFGIVSHHGTGISNIDGTFRLLKTISNPDMCVIGHTHAFSMKTERTVEKIDNDQYYHDITCVTLPSSGGGTYGAGMALPDTHKQSAVWIAISSQPNPYAGKTSPSGVKYPEFIPTIAFFNPSNTPNNNNKINRHKQAQAVIQRQYKTDDETILAQGDDFLSYIAKTYEKATDKIVARISEKPIKLSDDEQVKYLEYLELLKNRNTQSTVSTGEETVDEMVTE